MEMISDYHIRIEATVSMKTQSFHHSKISDWSLSTGRGATKQEAGYVKFYTYEKGVQKKF